MSRLMEDLLKSGIQSMHGECHVKYTTRNPDKTSDRDRNFSSDVAPVKT